MSRPVPWFWIAVAALLLLLPKPAWRVLLDLLGGLTLTLLLLPLLASAVLFFGWQALRSRMRSCPSCGVLSLATDVCPACGSSMQGNGLDGVVFPIDALETDAAENDVTQVTINVQAVEVDISGPGSDSSAPGR